MFDGERRRAGNSQSACVQLVDGPLFLRIISTESPQQYTRLFTISTVYSSESSFTLHSDWKDKSAGCRAGRSAGSLSGGQEAAGAAGTSETEKRPKEMSVLCSSALFDSVST